MQKWKDRSKESKKWFLIKIISGVVFLTAGTVFGIITLYLNGWNIVEFLKNPTTDLIILILIAMAVLSFSWKSNSKKAGK